MRETYLSIILISLLFYSCGYKVLNVNKSLKNYSIRLGKVKNLTTEYGTEQELIKVIHKAFLSKGVRLLSKIEKSDYEINIVIKNIHIVPLTYTKGIDTPYSYEYQCKINAEIELINLSDTLKKMSFRFSESDIYFSMDAPASTEANKRLAMNKVLNKIIEQFLREFALGVQRI